jgi:ABC-type multidrug transport system ATPase subunit
MSTRSLQAPELCQPEWSADVVALRPALPPAALPLVLDGVTKRWRAAPSPVLDAVSLALAPGTTTLICGRNGVGKTTLMRIAAGLIDPEQGTAAVLGATVHEHRARYQRLVAFLPAGDRGLYARLTVKHHLEFWARIAMVPRARLRAAVEETIDAFELRALAARRVDRMSMGQRQRLRIAMTFLPEPAVVLLDEPLTSLDSEGVELLQGACTDVLGRDGAVLWCVPNEEHARGGFDARWTLREGRLVADD